MMSQRIITVCDFHPEEEEAPAVTVQLAVRLFGQRGFTMVEVDLCPEHAGPLAGLVETYQEVGRPWRAPGLSKAQRARPVELPSVEAAAGLTCPVCGHPAVDERALRQHARVRHDMSLEQARGEQLDWVCTAEDCGRGFKRRQGLLVHTRAKHPDLAEDTAA
jgi:hypothetical protein